MKKLLLLLIVISLFVSCKEDNKTSSKRGDKGSKSEIFSLIPERTDALIKFNSLKDLLNHTGVKNLSEEAKLEFDKMKEEFGVDPTDEKSLRENGVDPSRELAVTVDEVSIFANDPVFKIAFMIPVVDYNKLKDLISNSFTKDNSDVKITEENGLTIININDIDSPKFYMKNHKDYLLLTFGSSRENDGKNYLESFVNLKNSVDKNKNFAEISGRVNLNDDIVFYYDFKSTDFSNLASIGKDYLVPSTDQAFKQLKSYNGMFITLNFSTEDLLADAVLSVDEGSDVYKMTRDLKFDKLSFKGIELPALLFVQSAFNVDEYYKFLMKYLEADVKSEYDKVCQDIKDKFGVDVEEDVIGNLSGSFNYGVFDGASINMMNYNMAATIGIKNRSLAEKTVEKFVSSLPDEQKGFIQQQTIEGIKTYIVVAGFTQIYLGITDSRLVVAPSKFIYEKAIKDSGKGFTEKLSSDVKEAVFGDNQVVYLDFNELISALQNFSSMIVQFSSGSNPLSKDKIDEYKKLNYLLSYSHVDENIFISNFKVETSFGMPFFLGIKDMFEKISK
ncbi:MAG: hypothetical protein CR982_06310 [Candidatus Cloacimonadota bacterium]|nr:MAG: hypothetical protein CR982_06310 [Candidatus Cloacimonadota bacterium]PIE78468.1 MAG: hypothetical protein CSA15_07680 [Candidatus Delongbacteria bacterium]